MPTKKLFNRQLAVLLAVTVCIGVYKAATLGAVSNDSVTFLEFADQLRTAPAQTLRTQDQHPGYPAGILLAQNILETVTGRRSLQQNILAGQIVNLLSRVVAIGFIYGIFLFVCGRRIAFFNAMAVVMIAAYADNGSDVLSDWPNLMFMAAVFFCCLKGLKESRPLWFLAAGIASGLAYWVRPEGLFFLPVTGVFAGIHILRSSQRRFLVSSLLLMAAAAILIISPYMLYKGKLFPKKHVGDLPLIAAETQAENATPAPRPSFLPTVSVAGLGRAALHFLEKTGNTIYLLTIPFLLSLYRRLVRIRRLSPQDRFLLIFILLWLLMVTWLYLEHGYMSHRHIMPMLVFSFAWLYQGLLSGSLLCLKRVRRVRTVAFVTLVVCLAFFVPKLVTPARADKKICRDAGVWLCQNTSPDAELLVFDNRIGFYAERPYQCLGMPLAPMTPEYIIVRPKDGPQNVPEQAVPVKTGSRLMDEGILIYALPGQSASQ